MLVTIVPVNDIPVAALEVGEGELVDDGLKVGFTDKSHDGLDPEGAITAWNWDFGDGNTSTQQHPEHVYTENGTYTVILTVTDNAGASASMQSDVVVVITSNETQVTYTLALHGNYPNPFNPTTNIQFEIPDFGLVDVSVYNLLGQKVATVAHQTMAAGKYDIPFDASRLSSGMYLYVMRYNNKQFIGRMTLVK
jgi:PKD repeat protein